MDINENTKLREQKHEYYEEFELEQFILNFEDPLEKVVIMGYDKDGNQVFTKEFVPKFTNSHLNITWQDKGIKSEESLYEWKQVPKE